MGPEAPRASGGGDTEHRPEIDGLRALAVLAVVIFHGFAPVAHHVSQTPLEAVGAHGVDLFFVISGLCLSLPFASGSMRTVRDGATFFRRRLTRIAPTYYVALALFAGLALTPFGIPGIETRPSAGVQLHELVRDALFYPAFFPIHDQPIWTLGLEMRWYVLFPPILLLFHRSKIAFAALAVASWWIARTTGLLDCSTLPMFMIGIVAAESLKTKTALNKIWPFIAPVALALAANEQAHAYVIDHGSALWALACFSLVMTATTNPLARRIFALKPLVAIGVASYSIYLFHFPFLNALAWAGVPAWLAAAASVAIGWAFFALVERPLGGRTIRAHIDRALVRAWYAATLGLAGPRVGASAIDVAR